MLIHLLFLFFTILNSLTYSQDSLSETEEITEVKSFCRQQETYLKEMIFTPSLLSEALQQVIKRGIQILSLLRLDNALCHNERLGEQELSKHKGNFLNGEYTIVDGKIANTLILINLRADNDNKKTVVLSYFTTPEIFLSCETLLEYCKKLAILNEWNDYSNFTVTVVPKGAYIQSMHGLTASKQSDEKSKKNIKKAVKEIIHTVGAEKSLEYTYRAGGAPQLFIAYASEAEHYDLGKISNKGKIVFCIQENKEKTTNTLEESLEFIKTKLIIPYGKIRHEWNVFLKSDAYKNPYFALQRQLNQHYSIFMKSPVIKTLIMTKQNIPAPSTQKQAKVFQLVSSKNNVYASPLIQCIKTVLPRLIRTSLR
jgi:hypothetical protein